MVGSIGSRSATAAVCAIHKVAQRMCAIVFIIPRLAGSTCRSSVVRVLVHYSIGHDVVKGRFVQSCGRGILPRCSGER